MDNKKLLTFDDLYNYYSAHSRSLHFSSKDNGGYPIVVQVPARLSFDTGDNSTEGLLPVVLQSCHIGKNINQTVINEDVMRAALPSFANRPILGYIHEVDGEWQFYKHNLHEDEDGEIIYDEIPIGIVPESCNAKLEYDEQKGKTYVVVNGYIFEEYTKAGDILRREKECSVSVEIEVRELSYNAKEKCLIIEDMFFRGVTILGVDPEGNSISPGMEGSNIKLADFKKNNSFFIDKYETQIIEMQKNLNNLMTCFNIDNSKKGGVLMSHFEELLSKYGKTTEDITFEHEGMSDGELDAKFEELFGSVNIEHSQEDESEAGATENAPDETEQESQEEPDATTPDNFIRTYELSHDDIRCSLYQLLSATEEADGTEYYIMEVFDEYFVYGEWYDTNKVYGQAYAKDGETVSFVGDRYDLFMELLTASEKTALDAMRSNYESISKKLKDYEDAEAEAKKMELLEAEDYNSIRDDKEFSDLVNNHTDISYDELQAKCDQILLNVVKAGKYSANNSSVESNMISKKQFANPKVKKTKPSRYGNLFSKDKDE